MLWDINWRIINKTGFRNKLSIKKLNRSNIKMKFYISKKGIKGLESKTGKKKGPNKGRSRKKPKPKYEDISKEELIDVIKANS